MRRLCTLEGDTQGGRGEEKGASWYLGERTLMCLICRKKVPEKFSN